MQRKSERGKVREWSRRLKRFVKSDQTVAEFCRAESVSEPSFYYWKRKLGVKSKLARRRQDGRQLKSSHQARLPVFKPVHVLSPESMSAMTIRLPDGIVVELGNDIVTIEKVMSQLLGHQPDSGAKSC